MINLMVFMSGFWEDPCPRVAHSEQQLASETQGAAAPRKSWRIFLLGSLVTMASAVCKPLWRI